MARKDAPNPENTLAAQILEKQAYSTRSHLQRAGKPLKISSNLEIPDSSLGDALEALKRRGDALGGAQKGRGEMSKKGSTKNRRGVVGHFGTCPKEKGRNRML